MPVSAPIELYEQIGNSPILAPHIGHLYSSVLADIIKRWQLLGGRRAILCTGTDEHGMKVQQAAAKAGAAPKVFCDQLAEQFKVLANRGEILYDHFIRTTDPKHIEAVQYAWHLLREKDLIYMSKHEGWYAVSDETFYPESQVHLVIDPSTGRKHMASIETGKEVEWTSEPNYHFRLSSFQDRLMEFYQQNPRWIDPPGRMTHIVQEVTSGLEDLSVSRPRERLSWGIPVLHDSTQTMYVWLDALLNYTTAAGYPWPPGKSEEGGWPADCHVIGKDIIRFHCIYWPAFLLALDLPLPAKVLSHSHWTLGKQKMSKSAGNVVNPLFALDRFGSDVMRFFLAYDGRIVDDSDYDNFKIIERYKKILQGGLGNLASRILRAKAWNVHAVVKEVVSSGRLAERLPDPDDQNQARMLKHCINKISSQMQKYDIPGATASIVEIVAEARLRFFYASSPRFLTVLYRPIAIFIRLLLGTALLRLTMLQLIHACRPSSFSPRRLFD